MAEWRSGQLHTVPEASQFAEIDMSVTMEIEVSEIRNRFVGAAGRHFADPHETS